MTNVSILSTANRRGQGKSVEAKKSQLEAKDCELRLWTQLIHRFFNQFFFPAYEQNQLSSRHMKEEKTQQSARWQTESSTVESALEFNDL